MPLPLTGTRFDDVQSDSIFGSARHNIGIGAAQEYALRTQGQLASITSENGRARTAIHPTGTLHTNATRSLHANSQPLGPTSRAHKVSPKKVSYTTAFGMEFLQCRLQTLSDMDVLERAKHHLTGLISFTKGH